MNWPEETVQEVWEKGVLAPGADSRTLRLDACGAWIARGQYGNRQSAYGWEIDHIDPHGPDDLPNLLPLQWENNARKGDGPLVCVVKATGGDNRRIG